MQTTLLLKPEKRSIGTTKEPSMLRAVSLEAVPPFQRWFLWLAIKLRIFWWACVVLQKPLLIRRVFKMMLKLRTDVWGGNLKKMYSVDGKIYFNLYTPGWPSRAYDDLIKKELLRHTPVFSGREKLSFVHLAITRKCPLRCEHCFEWDNLNQRESFTKDDLLKVVDLYKKEGAGQLHFSGGEPMVRFKDLVELVAHASADVACWVLTSGFNFTRQNARQLKWAGCTGVVVSIDHYIPELHNLFRGKQDAFANAVNAVAAAKETGIVTAISVCATKAFLDGGHLMPYLDFAKNLGVQFVQVLEPRQIGHYAGQDVLLSNEHLALLEKTFTLVNHSAAYRHHPTMLYHGYHQRRVGCFAGSRSVYIDSAGDVHACPFCHTRSYNIIELVRANASALPAKENACPRFGKIA